MTREAIKGKTIHDAMNSIENRVRHVYNQGFEEGKDYYIQKHDDAYNKGLEDAWECARKIFKSECATMKYIFHTVYYPEIILNNSPMEAIAKIKEYEERQKKIEKSCDNCGHRFDVSCEILDSGECCINEGKWIPKQTEKSCENCGYSYGQHKEYCNISGCCDYRKWTQAQVCNTCKYSGDNYEKFDIGFHEKRTLHCNCCHNFDGYAYASICDDDKIMVGDQLEEITESSAKCIRCVVLKISDCVTVVYDDGEVGYINPECYRKTGKHFPELLEFIEKMKEK